MKRNALRRAGTLSDRGEKEAVRLREGFDRASGYGEDHHIASIPEGLSVDLDVFGEDADKVEVRAVGKGAFSDRLDPAGQKRILERTAQKGLFTDGLQVFRQNEIGFHIDQNHVLIKRDLVSFIRIGDDPVSENRGIVFDDPAEDKGGYDVEDLDPVAVACQIAQPLTVAQIKARKLNIAAGQGREAGTFADIQRPEALVAAAGQLLQQGAAAKVKARQLRAAALQAQQRRAGTEAKTRAETTFFAVCFSCDTSVMVRIEPVRAAVRQMCARTVPANGIPRISCIHLDFFIPCLPVEIKDS